MKLFGSIIVLLGALFMSSCNKEPNPTPSQPNSSSSNSVIRYYHIILDELALDGLKSLTYDDGTGNTISLNSADAKALFIYDSLGFGNQYYTNIEISSTLGHEMSACLDFYPPFIVSPFAGAYVTDILFLSSPSYNGGSATPADVNYSYCDSHIID